MSHRSVPPTYSRRPGLEFIHDEASDGSSRSYLPVTKGPTAPIEPGEVLAVFASDSGIVPFDPAGTDGSQTIVGIAISGFVAVSPNEIDRRRFPIHTSLLTNRADVIGSRLIWPEGITPDQKAAAVAQLAALGIAVL